MRPASGNEDVHQCDASRTVTGVDVDREHYCSGTLTAMLVEMPWWQPSCSDHGLAASIGSPSVGGKAEAAPGSPTLGTWTEVIEGSQAAPPT